MSALNIAEKFMLWAFRLWVHQNMKAGGPHGILREAFRAAGVPDAYLSFNEMLTHMNGALAIDVEVHCPRCKSVGADELVLVSALAALQNEELLSYRTLMSGWMAEDAVQNVLPPMSELALALRSEGLYLRDWSPHAAIRAPIESHIDFVNPDSTTLH